VAKRKQMAKSVTIHLIGYLLATSFGAYAQNMVSLAGQAQGTSYHIKYFDEENRNLKPQIDSILNDFDKCLSLYREDSELSVFNRSHAIRFQSPYFYEILKRSKEIYEATNGVFDPTVMPLVEAYGFGPKKNQNTGYVHVDSLLQLIGFQYIDFDSISVQKAKDHIRLDFNSIAQGYSVDLIGAFLESKNISRYMVEIGGEIICKGYKNNGQAWVTGIDNPLKAGSLHCTVQLTDRAMSTAGNYRNHFIQNGQVYNHIVNPKTGSMEQSSILSVTVFAKDALTADGYDTAFFIMGLEQTKTFISKNQDIDVYILYNGTDGRLNAYASPGIRDYIKLTSSR
jgi:thiamine biosynthesis lipoprotein